MHVRWFDRRILLDNFFNAHSLPVTPQNCRHANPRPGDNRLSAAASLAFLDIPVVKLGHQWTFR
jgi:hypothetical protein